MASTETKDDRDGLDGLDGYPIGLWPSDAPLGFRGSLRGNRSLPLDILQGLLYIAVIYHSTIRFALVSPAVSFRGHHDPYMISGLAPIPLVPRYIDASPYIKPKNIPAYAVPMLTSMRIYLTFDDTRSKPGFGPP